jgi:gamma-glutamylcyclotransferase (GGCT)/AIG2-like uncharacterized protein YtfP
MKSYGSFPGVIDGGDQSIWGEIYNVDNHTLAQLDHLEGNGMLYQRREVPILTDEGNKITAWMYVLLANSGYQLPGQCAGIEILDIDGFNVANWIGRYRYYRDR